MPDHSSVHAGSRIPQMHDYADLGATHLNAQRKFLRACQALVQGAVLDTTLTAPPGSPADGDAYIIREGTTPTGSWSGQAGKVAVYSTQKATDDTNTKVPGWEFYTPNAGFLLYDETAADFWFFDGSAWSQLGIGGGVTLPIAESDVTGLVSDLAAKLDASKHGEVTGIRSVSGTSDTLVLADKGGIVECANASAITVTIPPNSSVAFPVKSVVTIVQSGAGQVTVSPGSGVTLKKRSSTGKTSAQEAVCQIVKVATDTWRLFGDLEA